MNKFSGSAISPTFDLKSGIILEAGRVSLKPGMTPSWMTSLMSFLVFHWGDIFCLSNERMNVYNFLLQHQKPVLAFFVLLLFLLLLKVGSHSIKTSPGWIFCASPLSKLSMTVGAQENPFQKAMAFFTSLWPVLKHRTGR